MEFEDLLREALEYDEMKWRKGRRSKNVKDCRGLTGKARDKCTGETPGEKIKRAVRRGVDAVKKKLGLKKKNKFQKSVDDYMRRNSDGQFSGSK